jgi:hypothetical protein
MTTPPDRIWPFVALTIIVCAAAGFAGFFFGALAAGGYGQEPGAPNFEVVLPGGMLLGTASGLLVGGAWCWYMIRLARSEPGVPLILQGALFGLLSGLASTLVLHAGLMANSGMVNLPVLGIGLLCGIVAGLVVGLMGGVLCKVARILARRPVPPAE